MMSLLTHYRAALAATLIDAEIVWMLGRMPAEKDRTPFHLALRVEAERRGLRGQVKEA